MIDESNRSIARRLGMSPTTVGAARVEVARTPGSPDCPFCVEGGPATAQLGELCQRHRYTAAWTRWCAVCGNRFEVDRPDFTYSATALCSDKCRREREADRGYRRRLATRQLGHWQPCQRCGERFSSERSDARYCSTRCRTAAHRARRA